MSEGALFRKYVDGYTVGELPKPVKTPDTGRLKELGYVETADGWVHHTEAALLPQGGRLVWVKMG